MAPEACVTTETLLERLASLPLEDRAGFRANPFAVASDKNELVTADHIYLAGLDGRDMRFECPKCRAQMRFFVNAKGTPFFAHAAARGSCPSGSETPSHLCIKRGLHSIGFSCETPDSLSNFKFDAYHAESDTAVEVISSGTTRYFPKIRHMNESGRRCWWIMDSGSKELGTKKGSESISVRSLDLSGHVIVSGLFKPKAIPLFEAIGNDTLYAFYWGLIWKSCGEDRWQLLDASHPLSQAATADDGMKCLMVRLHNENANTATELKRRGITRKTWFDSTWRYRGEWTTTWRGDRDYIVELVRKLIADTQSLEKFVSLRPGPSRSVTPSPPVHRDAEEILRKINDRHGLSLEDAKRLRDIANSSTVTKVISAAEIALSKPTAAVVSKSELNVALPGRMIVSSRWSGDGQKTSALGRSIHDVNRQPQQLSASKEPVICECGSESFAMKSSGKIRYWSCMKCGKNVGNSWLDSSRRNRSVSAVNPTAW